MKKNYGRPNIEIEKFANNEFVAICGYRFRCFGGEGFEGRLWEDVNQNDILDSGDVCLTPGPVKFSACEKTHIIPKDSKWFSGFFCVSDIDDDPDKAAKDPSSYYDTVKILIWQIPEGNEFSDKKFHASYSNINTSQIVGNS